MPKYSTYHLQHNDVHFHLVKINNENINQWKTLNNKGAFKNLRCKDSGRGAFTDTLNLFEKSEFLLDDSKELWVGYAASRLNTVGKVIDISSIEMVVTVTTSVNTPFVTHMGITRLDYLAKLHKNLSIQLHSFVAKAMLEHHADKVFMLTRPISEMGLIIFLELQKNNLTSHLQIGDLNHTCKKLDTSNKSQKLYSDLITEVDNDPKSQNLKEIREICNSLTYKYFEHKHAQGLEKGHNFIAIHFEDNVFKLFNVKRDDNGNIIKDESNNPITYLIFEGKNIEDLKSEFAWFFKNHHIHTPSNFKYFTLDYSVLAKLTEFTGSLEAYDEIGNLLPLKNVSDVEPLTSNLEMMSLSSEYAVEHLGMHTESNTL